MVSTVLLYNVLLPAAENRLGVILIRGRMHPAAYRQSRAFLVIAGTDLGTPRDAAANSSQ
jgi:hypothetical protein